SDSWTTLAPMPQPLLGPGFGAIDGKLYIAGGFNGSVFLNTLYIYDISTGTWSTGANLPQLVGWPGSTVFDDGTGPKRYLYGGEINNHPRTLTDITQIYDPVTNTWSTGPDINVMRFRLYGTEVVDNDSIVAPGGWDANLNGLNDNEQLINVPCATPTPT